MSQHSEAIRLAEASDWKGLQRLIEKAPECACERGDYGMLPIHWACTEPRVPLALLDKLLAAYPEGARTKNEVHLLPLHIAIRANVKPAWLQRLLAVYPHGVHVDTPDGLSVLDLADQVKLGDDSMKVLLDTLDESPEQDEDEEEEEEEEEDEHEGDDDDEAHARTKYRHLNYQLLKNHSTSSPERDSSKRYTQLRHIVGHQENDDVWPPLIHGINRLTSTDTSDAAGSPMMRSMSSLSDDGTLNSPHDNLISPSSTSTSSHANSMSSTNSAPLPLTDPVDPPLMYKQMQTPFQRKHSLDFHHAAAAAAAARQQQEPFATRSRNQSHSRSAVLVERGPEGGGARHQSLPVIPSFKNFKFASPPPPPPPMSTKTQHDMYHDRCSSEEDESEHARRRIHLFSGIRGLNHGGGGFGELDRGSNGIHFESPPEWKRDDECSICRASFGMFKHRHHCRNCGKSICSQHSADRKIAMASKGFKTPQRVCVTCYAVISHSRSNHDSPNRLFESMLDSAGISKSNNPVAAFALQHQQQMQQMQLQQQQQQHYALGTQMLRSPRYASQSNGSPTGTFASTQGSSTSVNNRSSHQQQPQQQQQQQKHTMLGNNDTTSLSNGGDSDVSKSRTVAKEKLESLMLQAHVSELRHVIGSQQKQIEQLVQNNIQMQQQILDQEELKAETMLLITQLMTRVSVLELQKADERQEDSFSK